jgi:hypothetical protein
LCSFTFNVCRYAAAETESQSSGGTSSSRKKKKKKKDHEGGGKEDEEDEEDEDENENEDGEKPKSTSLVKREDSFKALKKKMRSGHSSRDVYLREKKNMSTRLRKVGVYKLNAVGP